MDKLIQGDDNLPIEQRQERTAFLAERIAIPQTKNKNKKKKAQGKVFDYYKESADVRKGIDESRGAEWDKWEKFGAAYVISDEETIDSFAADGVPEIPLQWIDTDKNEHARESDRKAGKKHDIEHKSRMVVCGQLERCEGLRTDSPTCPVEGVNIIIAWCACNNYVSKRLMSVMRTLLQITQTG